MPSTSISKSHNGHRRNPKLTARDVSLWCGFDTGWERQRDGSLTGLEFWQTYRDPVPQHAALSDKRGKARRDAFVGLDVAIAATLPDDGEVAVLSAASTARLHAALKRIMDAGRFL